MLAATLLSATLLALIARGDPKRLRNEARTGSGSKVQRPMRSPVRRVLGVLSALPGVVLAILGEWWAFLVWFGAITAIGWIAANVLAVPGTATFDRK